MVKRIERKEIEDFGRNRDQVNWTVTMMTRAEHKNNSYLANLNPFVEIDSKYIPNKKVSPRGCCCC